MNVSLLYPLNMLNNFDYTVFNFLFLSVGWCKWSLPKSWLVGIMLYYFCQKLANVHIT